MQNTNIRSLSSTAVLTTPAGQTVSLGGAALLEWTLDEGADAPLLGGELLNASLTLRARLPASSGDPDALSGARLALKLIVNGNEQPCGVYTVERVSLSDARGFATIYAVDGLSAALAAPFEEVLVCPMRLDALFEKVRDAAGLTNEGVLPRASDVLTAVPDFEGATRKTVLSALGQVMGCAWRLDRVGRLRALPVLSAPAYEIGANACISLTRDAGAFGPVEKVRVVDADGAVLREVGEGMALTIEDNPILTACPALADGLLERVRGLTLRRVELRRQGTPELLAGQCVTVTDAAGVSTTCVVTRQRLKLADGFLSECVAAAPEAVEAERALTSSGHLNAARLQGRIDGHLLADGSVTAAKLSADFADEVSVEAVTRHLNALTEAQLSGDALVQAIRRAAGVV